MSRTLGKRIYTGSLFKNHSGLDGNEVMENIQN